jgi:hypothetical protein
MAELFTDNNDSMFTAERNTDMDLSSFLRKPASEEEPSSTDVPTTAEPVTTSKSPLEQELEKRKNEQLGISINAETFDDGVSEKPVKLFSENEGRMKELEEAQEESDDLLKKRACIVPLIQYNTQEEYVNMVNEIDRVVIAPDGTISYNYLKDANGNIIQPKYIRLRTKDDPPYSKENDKLLLEAEANNRERVANGQQPISFDAYIKQKNGESNVTDESSESQVSPEDVKKNNTVQLIIDKTGLGTDFMLTDEEKKKVVDAAEIKLTQVEVLDIASIKTVKPTNNFAHHVGKYTLSGNKTTISFPASGFKADMVGLTYGEIGDISLAMDAVNVDKYYKRLSTIYNKMTNLSCGPFESFDEFLKNFAFTDIPLAIYGLYVSSFPEVQTIALRCGRQTCGKTFDINFSTRNIIRLEKSDQVLLDHMADLAASDPNEYERIYKDAPVRNIKHIRLPYSGYIIDCGIISAYEFLYNFIPIMDENTFREAFGKDENQVYQNNVVLLTSVTAVRVPDPDNPGQYVLYDDYKGILNAIYNIGPEEIKILAAITTKIQREYQLNFSFGDVTCPHCKNITRNMDVTMDELVFQTYQRLISTEVDLKNIQGL